MTPQMGAIQFIENMDRTTLTITDEEFEQNVEAAVSAIAEKHRAESPPLPPAPPLSEKTGLTLQLPPAGESSSTRPSLDSDARPGTPRMSTSSDGPDDDKAAFPAILRTIQRPLNTIGRMFSDEPGGSPAGPSNRSPAHTPQQEHLSPRPSTDAGGPRPSSRHALSVEEAAARQASAETAEAQRLHRAEHANVVETLAGMFPDLDREIISDVVYQKEGRWVVPRAFCYFRQLTLCLGLVWLSTRVLRCRRSILLETEVPREREWKGNQVKTVFFLAEHRMGWLSGALASIGWVGERRYPPFGRRRLPILKWLLAD